MNPGDNIREFDVAVIGGGITGTGIARDLSLRGVKTVLLEKKDFSSGTTGICSGMIHGGMRYLLYDVATTRISCIDSGFIRKQAPYLFFRIPLIYPIFKDQRFMFEAVETFFEVYDRYVSQKNGRPHVRLNKGDVKRLEPGLSDEVIGAISTDEWGVNPFRLCTLNTISASEHGAEIRNHTEVIEFLRDTHNHISGIRVRHNLSGGEDVIKTKMVINAAGPWVPEICSMAGVKEIKLRPSKGTHIIFDRRLSNVGVIVSTIDKRNIFFIPHENTTILGCTDDDYYGDLDDIHGNNDEIEYLFQAMERVFPSIRDARMIRVMTGVRPTLFEWGKYEDDLSREYELFDHEEIDGVKGFLSIAGGKLAVYRMMARDITDLCMRKLEIHTPCTTHITPLPGADESLSPEGISHETGLLAYTIRRMISRHGSRTRMILEDIKKNPGTASCICNCEPVTEAEIRHVVRHEWARTLDDLRRRTRLGTGPCQGSRCTLRAAQIMGDELDLSPEEVLEASFDFLQERWKGKRLVMKDVHLAQEELTQAAYFGVGNIHLGKTSRLWR